MSIEALEEAGANIEEGLERLSGNQELYLRLVKMTLENEGFGQLGEALERGDLEAAFQAAHGLKGITGNMSLTPLYLAICDIVEPLRVKDAAFDYKTQYQKIMELQAQFAKILFNT